MLMPNAKLIEFPKICIHMGIRCKDFRIYVKKAMKHRHY